MKITISSIFFLWIILSVVNGKEQRSLTDDGLENAGTYGAARADPGHLLAKVLRLRLQKKILQDLKHYFGKENINLHVDDEQADDRKRHEMRAQLESDLTAWLNKGDTGRRGWGNGQLPWKKRLFRFD